MANYTQSQINQAKREIKAFNERIRSLDNAGLSDATEVINAKSKASRFDTAQTKTGHTAIRNTTANAEKWLEYKEKGASPLTTTLTKTHIVERAKSEIEAETGTAVKGGKNLMNAVREHLSMTKTIRDMIEEHAGERYDLAKAFYEATDNDMNTMADTFKKAEEVIIEKYNIKQRLYGQLIAKYGV